MESVSQLKKPTPAELLDRAKRVGTEVAAVHAADVDARARFPKEAFDRLRAEGLLGAFVPEDLGGFGCKIDDLSAMCEALGQHCASTAMIFAMHQIQVACLVRHGLGSAFFRTYLTDLARRQVLIASVTSEVGVGGSMRTSICAVERQDGGVRLKKNATTISYGEAADDLLITCRRATDAAESDQVLVLGRRADCQLEKTSDWDTLGMRGTCSPGFVVTLAGPEDLVLPVPFADISSRTMVPVSHLLWSSLWLGIATAAVSRARAFVREDARRRPGTVPPTATRLAEVYSSLQSMRANVHDAAHECRELMDSPQGDEALSTVGFALKINNLKIAISQMAVQVIHQALLICGIAGYKNDSKFSVGRHLRDAHSAALMVGNDRIYATNASLLLVLKDD
jgi:acyl-CoA dehydrogenase